MWRLAMILACFISCPAFSLAAVSLTEVAWMGDATSANNEWIELYNSGSASVDITGWTLGDGVNFSVALTGSIPAEEYVLLERNRSSAVYLVASPFLIYTGALVNTGATLTLRRADSTIEDQVAGGADWGTVGGDNATKETAQYISRGWVTAVATPGRVASDVIPNPDTADDNASGTIIISPTAAATNFLLARNIQTFELSTVPTAAPVIARETETFPFVSVAPDAGKTNFTFADSDVPETSVFTPVLTSTSSQFVTPSINGQGNNLATAQGHNQAASSDPGSTTVPIIAFITILILAVGSLFLPRRVLVLANQALE